MNAPARPLSGLSCLHEALEEASRFLPAQGPISVFVHHNTLHALEDLPFHEALARGSRLYETDVYLSELEFRTHLHDGRITDADLDRALEESGRLKSSPEIPGFDVGQLLRLALRHEIEPIGEMALHWQQEEGRVLRQCRTDLSAEARHSLLAGGRREPAVLAALWAECGRLSLSASVPMRQVDSPYPLPTERDLLLALTGDDANDLVHPVLCRLAASFLDDGTAMWTMPWREQGFLSAWARLVATDAAPSALWLDGLRPEVVVSKLASRPAEEVVLEALERRGIPTEFWGTYLTRLSLHLRGWAGMFSWLEHHPESPVTGERPVRFLDFLAVRTVYDTHAWEWIQRRHGGAQRSWGDLRSDLAGKSDREGTCRRLGDGAWRLFQLAQILGWNADRLSDVDTRERESVLRLLDTFDAPTRQRIWQEAFEGRYRRQFLGALQENGERPLARRRVKAPEFQVVCCIDEREEGFRRHLEEVNPRIETFGTAGFFGLAIDYQGLDDGRAAALCPVVMRPSHRVREVPIEEDLGRARRRFHRRRRSHQWQQASLQASQSLVRGTLTTPLLGLAAAIALPAWVLAPRLATRLQDRISDWWLPRPATRLTADLATTPGGLDEGFDRESQIERVATLLENLGLRSKDRFARILCLLGHGSESRNNPHQSAYECGACGGGQGGANARLIAEFANRPAVREGLQRRGIEVPEETWFVGGLHDTCSCGVRLFDLEQVPEERRADVNGLIEAMDEARARSAQERCRRFVSAPSKPTPRQALRHVESRAHALNQPRPELGHCTNAAAIVGRRERSRGLFLDRRSFLVSYDPTLDPCGTILERTLGAVGPVGAGISLEYYFSRVDPVGFGAGTKLPHNPVSLLGVMDGPASDLRTGLVRQMVELHEPMRLLMVVEAKRAVLENILERQPVVAQLVRNEWIQLVALSPEGPDMFRWRPSGWEPCAGDDARLERRESSAEWHAHRDGFLAPAIIDRMGGKRAA